MTQTMLQFTQRAKIDAARLDADVAELLRALTGRRWTVKTDLMRELGWTERRIQEAREHSDGRVISSSHKGYCLLTEATTDEVREVLGEITRRIKSIGKGYSAIARRFHRLQPEREEVLA